MNNDSLDSNITDKTDVNVLYEQYLYDISTGNIDFELFTEEIHNINGLKKHENSASNKEVVAAKVKGATISQDHIESTNSKESDKGSSINKGNSNELEDGRSPAISNDIEIDTSSTDPIEDLVREWESKNNTTFNNIQKDCTYSSFYPYNISKRNNSFRFGS